MGDFRNVKNVCGFYVSGVHLITMILPYIKKQIEKDIKTETFFEYNLKENANDVLKKLILKNEDRQKILNINWKNSKIQKYSNFEKIIKKIIDKEEEINILISGSQKYIGEINKMLSKYVQKNDNRLINKQITIINCYEVRDFNDNVRDILDMHEYILNTSGVHKIEEIFEDYKKKAAN